MGRRKCPTPRKQAHDSHGEAVDHLEEVRHHQPAEADGKEAYRCRCGFWHIGDGRGRVALVSSQRASRAPRWETITGSITLWDDGARVIELTGRNRYAAPLGVRIRLGPDASEGEFLYVMRRMVEQLEDRGIE